MMMRDDQAPVSKEFLINIQDLTVEFPLDYGFLRAVDHVNLTIEKGKMLGVIGESGCGKSTLAFAMMNAIPQPGRITEGAVIYQDEGDLLKMDPESQRLFRWAKVSVVFQASQNTLNPLQRIEDQIRDLARAHRVANTDGVVKKAIELCRTMKLDGKHVLSSYPHQLSGGMKQRVGIMMALLLQPELVIFDEPTTALDSLSQSAVLRIINRIHQDEHMTGMFITHDLGIVAEVASEVAVMYAGRIVELASVQNLFQHANHPYSQALLNALPRLTGNPRDAKGLPGQPPKVVGSQVGCLFRERCAYKMPRCAEETPPLLERPDGSQVACFLMEEGITNVGK